MRLLVILLAWFLRRRLDLAEWLSPDPLWRWCLRRAPAADAGHVRRIPILIVFIYGLLVGLATVASIVLWRDFGSPATAALALGFFLTTTGMPGWRAPLQAYGDAWRRGDMHSAWHHVRHLLPAPERDQAVAPEALHLLLADTLIVQTFERYFLPLFWFVVLGPAGVVLATLAIGLRNHYPGAEVRTLFGRWCLILGWLPAQLLSLSFGLAGDLAGWLQHWRKTRGRGRHYGLTAAASSALSSYALDPRAFEQYHPETWTDFGQRSLAAVRDLLNRSMWVWISVIALVAIAGWIP